MATKRYNWSTDQFEDWLKTRIWSEETKNYHRKLFKGIIVFTEDTEGSGFNYE